MGEELSSAWGRIAADGTVYVRTAAGERVVGSWHAGTAAEGLDYYARRYADLAAEVTILEVRLVADAANARTVASSVARLRAALPEASVVGDLDKLAARLAALDAAVAGRLAEHSAARAEQRASAAAAKAALVEEAERIAAGNEWKATGDRLRAIAEEWRALGGTGRTDKGPEGELWKRFATARESFTRRRGEHFAALDKQRKVSAARKEEIIAEATALAESTEWTSTAARLRDLLTEWKAAGRGSREAQDALWARFRAAQDVFFERRAAMYAEKDAHLRTNLQAREALLAEAEALDPAADLVGAQRRLRDIVERWEKCGPMPRGSGEELDRRLEAVQDRVRQAGESRWQTRRTVSDSPLVIRLRESVSKLEARAARARGRGDTSAAEEAEASLETQRGWLTQAERG